MELIQQILLGYLKGLKCFCDILGKFWEVMRGWLAAYGVARMGQKTNTDSTDVTDLSFSRIVF